MNKKENLIEAKKTTAIWGLLLFLEAIVIILLGLQIILPYAGYVLADVSANNVTVKTFLEIGNVIPEIINVSIQDSAASFDLTPNATTQLNVTIIARDYNGEEDIFNMTAEFFDNAASSYGAIDDNNRHYINSSCEINFSYGDAYEVSAFCNFDIWYYANNATWNATARATDNSNKYDEKSDTITMNSLLALGLPSILDYGRVNATEVSDEKVLNVTNFGNSRFNLTLSGYAVTPGDNLSMNCSSGTTRNISVVYEKYNLTMSNTSILNLSVFETIYVNLTSASVTKRFNLNFRQNDTSAYIDDTNATYWRIYVPKGYSGNCTGNIVFGAVKNSGT